MTPGMRVSVAAAATPAASASAGAAWTKYCGSPRPPLMAMARHAAATHSTGSHELRRQMPTTRRMAHPIPPTNHSASTRA